MRKATCYLITACLILGTIVMAETPQDTTPVKKLGVVATAHLDTQWRWTIQNTINEYIPNTLHDNFKLFEIYPDYVFSFEGAFRYMLAKEYYPDDYARMKQYIAEGRWRVAGSWVDAVDVNIPAFESLVRHALYGNGFYKKEFGKQSYDIFMPDCFGFGYALPSIATHCGLKSFSTQKLTWGCSVPVPFSIGEWQGVDGSSIVAGLKTGNYVATFRNDLTRDTVWGPVIDELGQESGCYTGYIYFGTGDVGGAPESLSVDWLEKSIHSDGPIKVSSIGADDLPNLISNCVTNDLPKFDGELVMTRHGVGCYTSQAAMKRWNRQNELLADAAERAAVTASLVGGYTYPNETLKQAWIRFLWHQFHDDLTGTSIPEAYEFSWSDELLSLNQFSSVLTSAVSAVSPQLDTRGEGTSYIVYNPLSFARREVVELPIADPNFTGARVFGPDNNEVPSQIVKKDGKLSLLFLSDLPSVGFAVYDVRPDKSAYATENGITVTASTMENGRYRLALNANGDVASIFDKLAAKELLAQPIEWELIFNKPRQWPAWEIQYEDLLAGRRAIVEGTPEIEILESGAVRGALKITRHNGKSTYVTVIRMSAGDTEDRIDFINEVDWAEQETLLKVAFRPTFSNDSVTYDLGLGAITRGLNTEKKYEVPAHQWADLAAPDHSYGLSVMNNCKYGWDHPDSATLRLTLIHTPGVFDSWSWVGDQSTQDIGHHRFTYSVTGHQNNWNDAYIAQKAASLNEPLYAFETSRHDGQLGKSFSLLKVEGGGQVLVNAVKKAENSDEIIVRVKELAGRNADNMTVSFANPISSVRQVNGQEEELGTLTPSNNSFTFALTPFQPKAFAVAIAMSDNSDSKKLVSRSLPLPYNLDGISLDNNRTDGDLDGHGNTLAGELLPNKFRYQDVTFTAGPTADGALNVVRCTGQELTLPPAENNQRWSDIYLLMLATDGPANGQVSVIDGRHTETYPISLYEYTEPVGQWNNRMVNAQMVSDPSEILPATINHTPIAWAGTHRHNAEGLNDTYKFTYVYAERIPLSEGVQKIVLPDNKNIKLIAASVSGGQYDDVRPVTAHYDEDQTNLARIAVTDPIFIDSTVATISSPTPDCNIRYTLDGSEPTVSSPLFQKPITLHATTQLRARAFDSENAGGVVANFNVKKLVPKPAATVDQTVPGLICSYYEGEWRTLPDFTTLQPASELVMDTVVIPGIARPEDYGLIFKGFVNVPTDGLYEFGISSDDGSALFVADTLVADNDGVHGDGEIAGKVALKSGFHPIEVRMFQCKGGQALSLYITGPGVEKKIVSSDMLFH